MITEFKIFEQKGISLCELIENGIPFEEIKKEIENGADVNQTSSYGVTPLMSAVRVKDLKLVEYLIENGADINAKNTHIKQCSALCYAAGNDLTEISIILLENGADVNQYDIKHRTILMRQISSMTEPTFDVFIKNKHTDWSIKDVNGYDILSYLSFVYKERIIKKFPEKWDRYQKRQKINKFNI